MVVLSYALILLALTSVVAIQAIDLPLMDLPAWVNACS